MLSLAQQAFAIMTFPGLCCLTDNFSCTSLTATIPDDMDSMSWWKLCSHRCRSPGSTNQMNQTNCICREKIRWRWICCLLYQLHRHIRAGWEGMHRMATNCSTEADLCLWGHSERVDFVWAITYQKQRKKGQWSGSSDRRRSQRIYTLLDQGFLCLSKTKNIVAEANGMDKVSSIFLNPAPQIAVKGTLISASGSCVPVAHNRWGWKRRPLTFSCFIHFKHRAVSVMTDSLAIGMKFYANHLRKWKSQSAPKNKTSLLVPHCPSPRSVHCSLRN